MNNEQTHLDKKQNHLYRRQKEVLKSNIFYRENSMPNFVPCPISEGVFQCRICSKLNKTCIYKSKNQQITLCKHIKSGYKPTISNNANIALTPPKKIIHNSMIIPRCYHEQIIYYPVIHNRIIIQGGSPQYIRPRSVQVDRRRVMGKSSFLGSTLPNEPYTPQYLKSMAASLINY